MNRTIKLLLLLALGALLAACKGSSAATTTQTPTPGADEIRLILGTLQLHEGDLAVDPAQAAELLPLWKAYRALAQSDTASEAERLGLSRQIRESMRPDQLAAIDALTLEDQARLAGEMGLPWASREATNVSPEEIATRAAERGMDPAAMAAPPGIGPGVGPGMGGAMMQGAGGGGGAAASAARAPGEGVTMVVRGQGPSMQARTTLALLDALIEYLEGIE